MSHRPENRTEALELLERLSCRDIVGGLRARAEQTLEATGNIIYPHVVETTHRGERTGTSSAVCSRIVSSSWAAPSMTTYPTS